MPVRRTIPYTFGTFFITFTNHGWMKSFDESNGYDVVYRWYDYLKEEGNFIHAYVIMPNHVHSIISFSENGQNINTTVGNGKRFMAYEIVERLKAANKTQLLQTLSLAVRPNRKKKIRNIQYGSRPLTRNIVTVWSSSYRNWITSIPTHAEEHGNCAATRRNTFTARPNSI